nr:hypothetical protein [Tanacetum cinerariifolium]
MNVAVFNRSWSHMSPSQNVSLSPSQVHRRSPSPMRRRNQRAPSTLRHQSSSPVRRKITNLGQQRSSSPIKTAERPIESRKASSLAGNLPPPPLLLKGQRVPALSPSPYNSPPGSVSPLAASHLPTGTQAQKRTRTNDKGRRKYSELAHEPLCSRKDILSSKREWVPEKGYKVNGINLEALKLTKAFPTVERQTQSGSFDSGSEETDHKKKRKRWKKKDVSSDDDDSHDSHIEDRKEAKRRHKEEKKLKKEEKHRRREERRHKKDSRRTAKLKLKAGRDVSPFLDLDKSHNSHEEALSDLEKLEIELREKALESLRAKKGVGR